MAIVSFGIEVNVVHEWKYCEYEWDSQEQKEDVINSGAFNAYTCSSDLIKANGWWQKFEKVVIILYKNINTFLIVHKNFTYSFNI